MKILFIKENNDIEVRSVTVKDNKFTINQHLYLINNPQYYYNKIGNSTNIVNKANFSFLNYTNVLNQCIAVLGGSGSFVFKLFFTTVNFTVAKAYEQSNLSNYYYILISGCYGGSNSGFQLPYSELKTLTDVITIITIIK